jgi:hypothetical protein
MRLLSKKDCASFPQTTVDSLQDKLLKKFNLL